MQQPQFLPLFDNINVPISGKDKDLLDRKRNMWLNIMAKASSSFSDIQIQIFIMNNIFEMEQQKITRFIKTDIKQKVKSYSARRLANYISQKTGTPANEIYSEIKKNRLQTLEKYKLLFDLNISQQYVNNILQEIVDKIKKSDVPTDKYKESDYLSDYLFFMKQLIPVENYDQFDNIKLDILNKNTQKLKQMINLIISLYKDIENITNYSAKYKKKYSLIKDIEPALIAEIKEIITVPEDTSKSNSEKKEDEI